MISKKTKSLLQKYGGAVPRYTSYPTALQFHEKLTGKEAAYCLASLQPENLVSLYIHIPFCHSLCHYCGCHTKIVNHTDVISAYVETLCHEIRLAAASVSRGITLSRVHFGGGSPNYAPLSDLRKILDTIRTAFPTQEKIKIDMECDPRLLSQIKVADLIQLGIGRFSLGVQDFDTRVQKAVNRIQPLEHVIQQVAFLRGQGIEDINFDLIVGLPEQTRESVQKTLLETIKIRPPRIAVFPYAHVPWMKKHQKLLEKYQFPTQDERFLMQAEIQKALCAAGYNAIGIDHYALPTDSLSRAAKSGALYRNFQGYTDDPARIILGFGLSAISQFEDTYLQNTLDAQLYKQTVKGGALPVARGCQLAPKDIMARKAVMQLMCHGALDLRAYRDIEIAQEQLAQLAQDGLVLYTEKTLKITKAGKPFTRVVAACFDAYFQKDHHQSEGRHAKAI